MLDHHNICWTVDSLRSGASTSTRPARAIVSYLPMAHIAERMITHYGGIAFGYEVTTCADIRLPRRRARRDATQHLLFGVPRTFEKIHSTVQAVLAADPGRAEQFAHALDDRRAGRRAPRSRRGRVPADLAAEYERVDAEVLRPARQLLGLDELRLAVTGGGADPGRGAPVLPQRWACRSRSSTGCRSRPAR